MNNSGRQRGDFIPLRNPHTSSSRPTSMPFKATPVALPCEMALTDLTILGFAWSKNMVTA